MQLVPPPGGGDAEGTGDGTGDGDDEGTGDGTGDGDDEGTGDGDDEGTGDGKGEGTGDGTGDGNTPGVIPNSGNAFPHNSPLSSQGLKVRSISGQEAGKKRKQSDW